MKEIKNLGNRKDGRLLYKEKGRKKYFWRVGKKNKKKYI